MKILMLSWEFPPFFVGGVGMVCYEIAKEFSKNHQNEKVELVLPYGSLNKKFSNNFVIKSANILRKKISRKAKLITSYITPLDFLKNIKNINFEINDVKEDKTLSEIYGRNILNEINLYTYRIFNLYKDEDIDIIHAHDWTTVPAAIALGKYKKIPVVFHVHITEFDKTGGNGGWEEIMKIEKYGYENSDLIITVSNFTKNRLINNYGVNPSKIRVVHNGGISDMDMSLNENYKKEEDSKIVLYAGRVTLQKGADYFVKAARKVLDYLPNTKFILAGGGDMLYRVIDEATVLGLSKNMFFTGRPYTREEAKIFFNMAEVFVMPSVSEPFGIVPLEAIAANTSVIISKQSGISEVLTNSFKVDFWDVDEMANKIVALLKYDSLRETMKQHALKELDKFTWEKPVNEYIKIYYELKNKS